MKRIFLALLLLPIMAVAAERSPAAFQNEIYAARDRVLPALVHIQPIIKDFQTGELKKQAVIGSGIIFHPDGYVVTNYHVAGKAERIICTLFDREEVPATYVGGDPPTDLAVIKLDLTGYKGKLHLAEFGNSDSVQVGQYVMAMGSPLALSRSVSAGIISTKDRYFSTDVRLPSGEPTGLFNLWIQTDAAINPGNSGGPLVDLNGNVVGINSRATFMANSLGFAIPVNVVKAVTSGILKNGKVTRSWIGVHIQALQELENYFGTEKNVGVLISSVDPGSPAEEAGLQAGDVILKVDGRPVSARYVEELPPFYARIAEHAPGTQIALDVKRDGSEQAMTLTARALGELQGEDFESSQWGFTVREITRQMQIDNQLTDTAGVYVAGVRNAGPAESGGLRRRDIITQVNRKPIVNLADFTALYNQLSGTDEKKVLLTVKRGTATRLAVINVDKKGMGAFHEDN